MEMEREGEAEHPLLQGLNIPQKSAVAHVEGPVLILAGAGSGKTKVITHRIAYLIQEKGVDPENILAVTFTNKAAREMRERVGGLLGHDGRGLWVTTFHSMGVRVLRKHGKHLGYDNAFSIYSESEQKSLVKRCLQDLNIDKERYPVKICLDKISFWKGESKSPSEVEPGDYDPKYLEIYTRYQEELKSANSMDFDDLLLQTVRLFREHPDVLELYQDQFHYIMVDEYQDTNPIQYKLIRALSKKHGNVCVVGDEDQSIYSWRGADIQNILDFTKDYAQKDRKVTRYELNINYRCPKSCLEAANHLIANNTLRTQDKQRLVSHKGGEDLIPYTLCPTAQDEALDILREIRRLKGEGDELSSIVILYRTHAQSRVLEQEFIRQEIPYQIFGSARFYERKEIKDILAYLSLLHNPFDTESLYRIINFPPRKIGATTIEKVQAFAQNHNVAPLLALDGIDTVKPAAQKHLLGFYELYTKYKLMLESENVDLFALCRDLIEEIELVSYWKGKEEHDRIANIEEFLNTVVDYQNEDPNASLEGFLEKTSLMSSIDDFEEGGTSSVTMMTLHNAKGLEFDFVFIVGMEEGLFPHKNSVEDPMKLEEERRLCYVGLTRTMKELFLTGARLRTVHGEEKYQVPSRFLREIGEDFVVRM